MDIGFVAPFRQARAEDRHERERAVGGRDRGDDRAKVSLGRNTTRPVGVGPGLSVAKPIER